MQNELEVNDVLRVRKDNYINALQRELVIAKNIIKRPFVLGKISTLANYEGKAPY
jgi:hypothetical protein